MSHYRSNLRDIEFNLFEVLGRGAALDQGPFKEFDPETVASILAEVERLAQDDLAASFVEADRHPPVFDAESKSVTMNPAFTQSYKAWMDAEWWRLQIPEDLGGAAAPSTLVWSIAELVLGANPAVWMYGTGPSFARIAYANGTERDKRIAQHMVDRRWSATMVLTEPDAGSDVGAGRTRATLNEDGTWNIEGVKRFITSGEHDMAENIMHFVLARPHGVEGAGGPGTKGLSLFLVPKHRFDLETGELTGERNGAWVTNVEKKMGLKVSTTCEITFGENEPARGWLLGEVHDGIAQMFQVIENARMLVGTKAIATLSTGYLNALDYARQRVQGADLLRSADKNAPRVTIIHHPDVRRSLMTQKAYSEGLRSLVLYTAAWQDEIAIKESQGQDATLEHSVNDFLLPIVKGYGSERSWVVLGTESLQTFGGSGFLQDYPLEQYVRDAKIDTLYEGTTAIQGQDLFFRKIVKDRRRAIDHLSGQIQAFIDNETQDDRLKTERELLRSGLADTQAILATALGDLAMSNPSAGAGDARQLYKVGLNTTRLVFVLGDLIVSWLLLRSADVALKSLAGDVSADDRAFYEGKVAAASFFARNVLPGLAAHRSAAENVDLDVMDLPEASF